MYVLYDSNQNYYNIFSSITLIKQLGYTHIENDGKNV